MNRSKMRSRVSTVLAALLAATALVPIAATPAAAAPNGRWDSVAGWPLIPIHMALDTQGRVVSYGTNGDGTQTGRFIYDVWTPNERADRRHNTLQNTTQTDLFCSLQINRPDTGDMLLFGGDNWTGTNTTNTGNPDINLFAVGSQRLRQLPGMNVPRWYATGTTLPDGSVYVQGGSQSGERVERWRPGGRGAELLPFDSNGLDFWYPRNWVIPDGRIFGFDSAGRMYYVNRSLTDLRRVGRLPRWSANGNSSTAVMYEPGKILQFGGTTRAAQVIDVTGESPQVTVIDSPRFQRSWGNATVLPDGRVLATGGSPAENSLSQGASLNAEMWDPATGEWTTLPAADRPRLYHSTALLLPDGRVLTGGGGAPGPIVNTNAEIFNPDYLFAADGSRAARPTISAISSTSLEVGESVQLTVDHNRPISRATMIKTGSVTHSFDMEQRFVELDITVDGDVVTADLPSQATVLTPGYYHVFVLDRDGVPSESEIVRIEATATLGEVQETAVGRAGGAGGSPFQDEPVDGTTVTSVVVWTGSRVDRVKAITSDGPLPGHGGTGGTRRQLNLRDGEAITAVFGRSGQTLDAIGFETSEGRRFGPFGGGGGNPFRLEVPDGYRFVGFTGRAAALVDHLGILIDVDGPRVTPPADMTVEATGELTTVDIGEGSAEGFPVTNDAPADGRFPLGDTTVTWSATDADGRTGTATQTVSVVDTMAPVVEDAADVVVFATGDRTEVDLIPPAATDLFGPVAASNDAPPGGFRPGRTAVTWTVTDANGNSATVEQLVDVLGQSDELVDEPVYFTGFDGADSGWLVDPDGTDRATAGRWEIGAPEATADVVSLQRGDTTSGSSALITGLAAGDGSGAFDVDNGNTTATSPAIELPPGTQTVSVAFDYYLAHLANASSADVVRVEVLDAAGDLVDRFVEAGTPTEQAGVWRRARVEGAAVNGSMRIRVAAADNAEGSLVEAGVDTVRVIAQRAVSPPTVQQPPDQTVETGDVVSLAIEASDVDDARLSYAAEGLPPGLAIDQRTGLISGTVVGSGTYSVTVGVGNGASAAFVDFTWTVVGDNTAPVIDAVDDQAGSVGDSVSLVVTATDLDRDSLRYAATGLPDGVAIDATTGVISGRLAVTGSFAVTITVDDGRGGTADVSFAWVVGQPAGFVCQVIDGVLSWNDQEVNRYFIRQVIDGEESYLTSVERSTSLVLSGTADEYIVRARLAGQISDARCPGNRGQPVGFVCQVTDGVLSWTDNGVARYFIRQVVGGVESYVATVEGATSVAVDGTADAYFVRSRVAGVVTDTAPCSP